jgi:tRNA A-37 threonylcarbamoyl transferase component Bud32
MYKESLQPQPMRYPQEAYAFQPKTLQLIEKEIGKLLQIKQLSGGLVHYVYRIIGERQVGIAKVRSSFYSALPHISANPEDIRYERDAIFLLSQVEPNVFPHLLMFDAQKAMILMTDVIPSNITLEGILNEGVATEELMNKIGTTLARVHNNLLPVSRPIREDGDDRLYSLNLYYRLGYLGHPVLDETVERLKALPRQLIIGDLSPKNIGLNGGEITICDLDYVHMGNVIFDVGFLTGHILVHSIQDYENANSGVDAFLSGYIEGNSDFDKENPLLKQIALGIVLYRLNNPVIPYNIPLTEEQKRGKTTATFSQLFGTEKPWSQIIQGITYAS